ncbi:hypothetical protein OG601_20285 [Streptomyces sp. NBC_01239]|uniref:hypothetical protein n=1 Tax=Streptomyces sp. NBC_01239 TaxID=2903792 RepID=UPI00224EF54E|nr:hypothetical protein [Streptomyces sp. NBC_01239]MCX4812937.1 hypothetical protein [Streptomyces sp. NBC_01239]
MFFVSARSNLFNAVTKSDLTSVGYTVDGLYARTVAQLLTDTTYKLPDYDGLLD